MHKDINTQPPLSGIHKFQVGHLIGKNQFKTSDRKVIWVGNENILCEYLEGDKRPFLMDAENLEEFGMYEAKEKIKMNRYTVRIKGENRSFIKQTEWTNLYFENLFQLNKDKYDLLKIEQKEIEV